MVYIRTILSGLFLALTFSRTGGAKHDLYPPIELRDLWLLFVVGGSSNWERTVDFARTCVGIGHNLH